MESFQQLGNWNKFVDVVWISKAMPQVVAMLRGSMRHYLPLKRPTFLTSVLNAPRRPASPFTSVTTVAHIRPPNIALHSSQLCDSIAIYGFAKAQEFADF